ncbi:hypothetical protein [Photobacterium leiognathi]|uniref:hypothetical protein n=1 Tax=Photobacterium leiognathi TaxID=553611 RepID=UPI002981B312|nr:hypothetical protein [Photobacterium leiognathi]
MRNYLALSLLCITTSTFAQTPTEDIKNGGYSYFSLGMENTTYKEKNFCYEGKCYNNSSPTVTSPTINSGGLYVINDTWDFSIDALGTFSPSHVEENWSNGQKNQFEYIKAATDVLLQYKLTPQWRVVAGPSLSYQTYKRYGRGDNSGVWEEKTTDIFVNAGFAYDSGALINNNWHIYMTAKAGIPAYSNTENTRVFGEKFSTFGFRSSISGGISYQLLKGVNVGLYSQLSYEHRNEDGPKMYKTEKIDGHTKGYFATLPEAEIINFSAGLQLMWKL